MAEPILSYELKALINKIKSEYIIEFPIQVITPNYLLLAIIEEKSCDGHSVISKLMMDSTIEEFKQYVLDRILVDTAENMQQNSDPHFSDIYDTFAEEIADAGAELVTSSLMLSKIIMNDNDIIRRLGELGVSLDQINETVIAYNTTSNIVNKSIKQTKWTKKHANTEKDSKPKLTAKLGPDGNSRTIPTENNIVESNCVNMVREASTGAYDSIIGYDDVIQKIFDTFGKYDRNTVAIVGPHGVGKTSVVKQLSNVLYKQKCPKMLRDKYVMKFGDTITNVVLKEMSKQGKYIAFIDDLDKMFIQKEMEMNNKMFLIELFNTQDIFTIFTISDTSYAKNIMSKPELERYIQRIDIEEPKGDFLYDILKSRSHLYEDYNNVAFDENCLKESVRLAKRFITYEACPSSALNILDTSGAFVKVREKESPEITKIKNRLLEIENEKGLITNSSSAEEFDKKDILIREEIDLNQKLNSLENKLNDNNNRLAVTISDMREAVSSMLNLPLSEMDDDEKAKLKKLSSNLRSVVIGQDSAIDDITRAVKRQRIGLQNPDKPIVMLFVGTTGVGKSFLAKRLAFEMFGDEKKIVRLDMSEYADKTSVNKMYGSSPGYVGYEEGGVLTEAIKKNNRCVLLLDEIEKAHEDVFNVLLQVFDEGRLTDNKGTLVDFKNVIIIMTSNVGAKDVSEKHSLIGFGSHDEDTRDIEIIKKSIKKTFKPEFINRIDNICFFNKLTDDNLRQIIINEVGKVKKKLEDIGYGMDEELCTGKLIDSIFENAKKEAEYGARPIIREIQVQLEDKITDYIIDEEVKPGFIFTYNDIYKDNG